MNFYYFVIISILIIYFISWMDISKLNIDLTNFKFNDIQMGLDIPIVDNSFYDTFNLTVKHSLRSCQVSCLPFNLSTGIERIYDIIQAKKMLIEHPEMYACFHGNLL